MRRVLAGFAIACALAAPAAARGDVVELTNGQRIEGTVLDASGAEVTIAVGGGGIRIPQQDVQSITIEPRRRAPASSAARSSPPPELPAAPATPSAPPVPAVPATTSVPPAPAAPATTSVPPAVDAAATQPAPSLPPRTPSLPPPTPSLPPRASSVPSAAAPERPTSSTLVPAPGPPMTPPPAATAPIGPKTAVVPPTPAAPQTSSAPRAPAPMPPRIAGALAVLAELQAATVNPLTPADYMARVDEATQAIGPALSDTSERTDVRDAIGAAVGYHAFAARAGFVYEGQGDLAALGRDPVVTACRPLSDLVARDARKLGLNASDPAVVGLVAATEGAPALRECAGQQIAEAERRARAPR